MSIQNFPIAGLSTDRLLLNRVSQRDASGLLVYYLENRNHLAPWSPLRSEDFYTVAELERRIEDMERQMQVGAALHLLIRHPGDATVIGQCSFSNIVRGPFQACHLGFSIAATQQRQGLMYEALSRAIEYVFDVYGLHRVMANYRPENARSGRLLNRLRFEIEGKARAYLKINGQWADHVLTSRIGGDEGKGV